MLKGDINIRRLGALLMVAVLFIQPIPSGKVTAAGSSAAWDGSIALFYQGGDGTQGNPYLIASGAQLARLASQVNAGNEAGNYYQLTSDINLGGQDWTPIGNENTPFIGSFDGMGHVISNLYISGSSLVSSTQSNEIRLNEVDLNEIYSDEIASDEIDSDYLNEDTENVSDISLDNISSETDDSIVDAEEVAEMPAAQESELLEMPAAPDWELSEMSELSVNQGYGTAGDLGQELSAETDDIETDYGNALSDNEVEAEQRDAESLHEDEISSGGTSSDNVGDGLTDVNLVPESLAETAAFREYTAANPSNEDLQAELEAITAEAAAAAAEAEAAGAETGQTFDPAELQQVLEDIERAEEIMESSPPDLSLAKDRFFNRAAVQGIIFDDVGLFGNISSGIIENTGVVASDVNGGIRTGGIVGYSAAGTLVTSCFYEGTVDSDRGGALGGIVGYSDGGISYCYNNGVIGSPTSNITYLGGIAGVAADYIQNCSNTGGVSGSRSYTGGIVGYFSTNKMISLCFNSGSIGTAAGSTTFIGGIAGYARNGIINNCANQGAVTGSATTGFIGGLAGSIYTMASSYNTGDLSGYYAAGLAGSIYGASMRTYNAGTITGVQNAAITCLLAGSAIVSNTTYWRLGSATWSIYSKTSSSIANPVPVFENTMRSDVWINNTLKAPFVPDISWYNQGYPIHGELDYDQSFPEQETINGTFSYSSERTDEESPGQKEEDYTAEYFYSDDYFMQGAAVYNPSLATMSLCLEMSAFGSNVGGKTDYLYKYRNAEQLLSEIGFEDIRANDDYKDVPKPDTIGVIVAHKDIEVRGSQKTVIALAIRGGGYEAEWGSNFQVGESGDHGGFSAASLKAHGFLEEYIEDHSEDFQDDVAVWMTGFSRAAATANLLAGKLTADGEIGGISLGAHNIYAYCFATPMGRLTTAADQGTYTNIHNIVNPYDLVTKVAPAYWSFGRYGVDEPVIPGDWEKNQEYYDEMMRIFRDLETEWVEKSVDEEDNEHVLYKFKSKHLDIFETDENDETHFSFTIEDNDRTMSEFLDSLVTAIAVGAGGRETYAMQLQGAIGTLAVEFMGGGADEDKWQEVPAHVATVFEEHIVEILLDYFVWGHELEAIAYESIYEGILAAGIDIESAHYENINQESFSAALDTVTGTVIASLLLNGFDDFITLFYNMEGLITAHYPELYFSWLQNQDPNYEGEPVFFASSYRTIRINSAVDIEVYDAEDTLVAQFIEDVPQEVEGIALGVSLSSSGEKVLHLPSDESYSIRLTAAADGELDYSIGEYSYYTGSQTKLVNYYDVPVTAGDIIEGVIPEFTAEDELMVSEGSGLDYPLTALSGEIASAKELLGEDAKRAIYTVSAKSDDTEGGNVIGGGVYSEGAYTLVCAVANENHEFIGWYENNELVSTENIYEFRVEQNTEITAQFQ